jgi:hypothetical protein
VSLTAAEARCRAAHPSNAARRRAATGTTAVGLPADPVVAGRAVVAGRPAAQVPDIPRQQRRSRARPETVSCCGHTWTGAERAHCCRRTGGCGRVFDTARLFDRHRRVRGCLDPAELGLVAAGGIWLPVLDAAV